MDPKVDIQFVVEDGKWGWCKKGDRVDTPIQKVPTRKYPALCYVPEKKLHLFWVFLLTMLGSGILIAIIIKYAYSLYDLW